MSRVSNEPGDAVLSLNGLAKVNGRIVGVWIREDSVEVGGKNTFHFCLADSDGPVLSSHSITKFREEIGKYVREHNIPPIELSEKAKAAFGISKSNNIGPREDERENRKSFGGRISHVTRRIGRGERLKGKTLKTILEIISNGKHSGPLDDIANKLKEGQPLDEYERHYLIDSVLVHARLG